MTECENKIFGFILNNSLIRHERGYFWLEFLNVTIIRDRINFFSNYVPSVVKFSRLPGIDCKNSVFQKATSRSICDTRFFAIVSESLEKLTLEENFKKLIYDSLVDDSESFLH